MHRIEPAACLINPFTDKVRRESAFKKLLVLERIMKLCKRHRSGIEPHIDKLRCPFIQLAVLLK